MKQTLLFLLCTFFVVKVLDAQVVGGQIDNFEDGTTQGWSDTSDTGFENISTGGPDGVDDNYLKDTATGTNGAGSRLVIRSLGAEWSGNFTSEGVFSIRFNARAQINDLDLRISVTGPGGKFSSANFVTVEAGSGWTLVIIPITASDFVSVSDGSGGGSPGTDIDATLAAVSEMRILSNPNPAWRGEVIDAEMNLDNIAAVSSLSTDEFKNQNTEFTISPNPSKNSLNIKLPNSNEDMKLEVFDVLGKRVHKGIITQLQTLVNVSSWRSGVYLVRLSNDKTTQTKRFIKQ